MEIQETFRKRGISVVDITKRDLGRYFLLDYAHSKTLSGRIAKFIAKTDDDYRSCFLFEFPYSVHPHDDRDGKGFGMELVYGDYGKNSYCRYFYKKSIIKKLIDIERKNLWVYDI